MNIQHVNCQKIHFDPGDRLLVTSKVPLNHQQVENLKIALQKWAGVDIPVFIRFADTLEFEVERQKIIS